MKPDEDLFSTALIRSYVSDPHFVERSWLEAQVETALAASDCRFLLLNAEPGAGKTVVHVRGEEGGKNASLEGLAG